MAYYFHAAEICRLDGLHSLVGNGVATHHQHRFEIQTPAA
jgi:hypothetical protein